MKGNHGEGIGLKPYILLIILILATFSYTNILIVRTIRSHYYQILDKQSAQYAESYAHSMSKAAQAAEVINELLEDKLLSATKTIALYEREIAEAALAELADSLGLDDIYYYNETGEIVNSNKGHYLGWQAYPGHPVHDFLTSDAALLVEDIRADTESGELNKYAYIKLNGGFVQIGIKAARVDPLLQAFHPEQLLLEIAAGKPVEAVCYLDSDFVIRASSNPELIGTRINAEEKVSRALLAEQIYSSIYNLEGRDVYQVYIPVPTTGAETGTLVIAQSLEETERLATGAARLGTTALIIVFAALLYTLYLTYRKKKDLLNIAYFHSLTKLPNRRYLENVLKADLAEQSSEKKALLLIHCRNLGTINHVHGFHYGDKIIREIAKKLQDRFKASHALFHFSANRFALYVRDYQTREELAELAAEIITALDGVLYPRGLEQQITTRVGIVVIQGSYADPGEIFTHASLALVYAQGEGSTYNFFSPDMQTKLLRENLIARELAVFLAAPPADSKLLHLEYQPIVDLKTERITAFEALARMHSPQLGSVFPLEFIGIAERQQLIVPLGAWVLETAARFLKKLHSQGHGDIEVSVNVSALELFQRGFPERVQNIVEKHNISPKMLQLEITESVMFHNFEDINQILGRLRDLGIKIALDDFGTGYSSFSRLGELNVDVIKIDKHFVDKITAKDSHKQVFAELIAMSHKLDLEVVAEGVEKQEQREYLKAHRCDLMQGYLFSRPLKEEAALNMLEESGVSA